MNDLLLLQNPSSTRISLSSPILTPATPASTCKAGPVEAVQSVPSHWSLDQKVSQCAFNLQLLVFYIYIFLKTNKLEKPLVVSSM